jgi:hypothetical protein
MGKGKRIRENRVAEQNTNREAKALKAKKEKRQKLATMIVIIVLLVGFVGGTLTHITINGLKSGGFIQRSTSVIKSENFKVDAAMMSYFINYQYSNSAELFSQYYGLKTDVSLKEQTCTLLENGGTWFDYFSDAATTSVKEYLCLAEAAKKEGLQLDDEDQAEIEATINEYKTYATTNGVGLDDILSAMFGQGVKEKDVRKCLELETLAIKYSQEWLEKQSYTDEELEAEYKKNTANYQMVDYMSYDISATDLKDKNTYAAAKAKAEELAKVKTVDEFKKWVENDYRASSDLKAEELDKKVKTVLEGVTFTGAKKADLYVVDPSAWLFGKAKVNETFIFDDEGGTYTVYFCVKPAYRGDKWKDDCKSTLGQAAFSKVLESLKTNTVLTINDKGYDKVSMVIA